MSSGTTKSFGNTAARLLVASVLQWPLLYQLFQWQFAGRPKHYTFPHEFAFTLFAGALLPCVILVPVLSKGDSVQRLLAVILIVIPVVSLRVALNLIVPFLFYAYE